MFAGDIENLFDGVVLYHRISTNRAGSKTGIALIATGRVEGNLAFYYRKSINMTGRDAVTAMVAMADGVGVVAGGAIEVAALQKQH